METILTPVSNSSNQVILLVFHQKLHSAGKVIKWTSLAAHFHLNDIVDVFRAVVVVLFWWAP